MTGPRMVTRASIILTLSPFQEAYGFAPNNGDLGTLTPSPPNDSISLSSIADRDLNVTLNDTACSSELSIDNTDVLTNALYATLQAVNPCELSPTVHEPTIPPASSKSPGQLTLNAFFAPIPSRTRSESGDRLHGARQQLKCGQCDYVATHRQNLHRHEKLHELRQLPTDQHRRFACSVCDRRFITKWAVKEHVKCKHPDEEDDGQESVELVLSKHFKCDYCGKTFPLRNAMKRHVATVHFKNRDYKCLHCEKAFGDNYHLQRHVQTVHMALRTHECPVCRKAFSSAYHVNRHVKNLHK